jgi:hypothetical protein
VHRVVAPDMKMTVPPGWPAPVTVAVRLSVLPWAAGLGLADSVVIEDALLTVSTFG